MATNWELGNDIRNVCDRLSSLEREFSTDLEISRQIIEVCRLAMGHLSNKLCDDGVELPSSKLVFTMVAGITSQIRHENER